MSRIERLNSLIRAEIADILMRRAKDPNIGFVSIVSVDTAKDLSLAKVYYSQIGSPEEKKKTYWHLRRMQRWIKGEVGKVLRVRTVPNIVFKYDDSLERGDTVISKLKELSDE
jgi:ribosome-binding factor A